MGRRAARRADWLRPGGRRRIHAPDHDDGRVHHDLDWHDDVYDPELVYDVDGITIDVNLPGYDDDLP